MCVCGVAILAGCAANIPFHVTSDPPHARVQVNGVDAGQTPTTVKLRMSKEWVGLFREHGGWAYGAETYAVTVAPPAETAQPCYPRIQWITPQRTPQGGSLFFNLVLTNAEVSSRD